MYFCIRAPSAVLRREGGWGACSKERGIKLIKLNQRLQLESTFNTIRCFTTHYFISVC